MCFTRSIVHPLPLALCPRNRTFMDCLTGLSCPLGSGSVHQWEVPAGVQEPRVGSGYLFPFLPSCCLNPSSKIHSSCRETLSYNFSYSPVGIKIPLSRPFRISKLGSPRVPHISFCFTLTLLMLLKILPTSCNFPSL